MSSLFTSTQKFISVIHFFNVNIKISMNIWYAKDSCSKIWSTAVVSSEASVDRNNSIHRLIPIERAEIDSHCGSSFTILHWKVKMEKNVCSFVSGLLNTSKWPYLIWRHFLSSGEAVFLSLGWSKPQKAGSLTRSNQLVVLDTHCPFNPNVSLWFVVHDMMLIRPYFYLGTRNGSTYLQFHNNCQH